MSLFVLVHCGVSLSFKLFGIYQLPSIRLSSIPKRWNVRRCNHNLKLYYSLQWSYHTYVDVFVFLLLLLFTSTSHSPMPDLSEFNLILSCTIYPHCVRILTFNHCFKSSTAKIRKRNCVYKCLSAWVPLSHVNIWYIIHILQTMGVNLIKIMYMVAYFIYVLCLADCIDSIFPIEINWYFVVHRWAIWCRQNGNNWLTLVAFLITHILLIHGYLWYSGCFAFNIDIERNDDCTNHAWPGWKWWVKNE